MPCLKEALGGINVVGQGLVSRGVCEQGVDGSFKLELLQALKEAEAVGGELPTKHKEVLSSLGLGTGLAVGVVDDSDAMQERGEGGMPCPELGYGSGSMTGKSS